MKRPTKPIYSIALSRFHFYNTQTLPSSLNPQNHEFIHTNFLGSSKQPKPINKITSFDQNLPPKAKNSQSNIPSGKHLKDELFCNHFLGSSKISKLMSKIISFGPMSYKYPQQRSFSLVPPDPCSGSVDSIPVDSTVDAPFESSPPIDAGNSMRKPISLWPGMYHSPVTNALWEARSSIFERLYNVPADAPSASELIAKPPSKSRTSIAYKFSTDYILREQYRNPWNEIRMGKLLEDLDALAGTISFKVIV